MHKVGNDSRAALQYDPSGPLQTSSRIVTGPGQRLIGRLACPRSAGIDSQRTEERPVFAEAVASPENPLLEQIARDRSTLDVFGRSCEHFTGLATICG
jgi:hypothetical protein